VYGAREYPMPLNMTDIKAGKCIVHSVDMVSAPSWHGHVHASTKTSSRTQHH